MSQNLHRSENTCTQNKINLLLGGHARHGCPGFRLCLVYSLEISQLQANNGQSENCPAKQKPQLDKSWISGLAAIERPKDSNTRGPGGLERDEEAYGKVDPVLLRAGEGEDDQDAYRQDKKSVDTEPGPCAGPHWGHQ